MNSIFSFQRFGNLMKKQFAEYYKAYLMGAGVLAGVLVLTCILIINATKNPLTIDEQGIMFSVFLMFAGAVFTSASFADAGQKKQAIYLLTLPATQFEKYLVRWVISYLLFFVVYVVLFYIVVLPFASLYHDEGKGDILVMSISTDSTIGVTLVYYSLVHSLLFFGAILFQKLHFIKTAFATFGILVLLNIINSVMIKQMLHQGKVKIMANPFSTLHIVENERVNSLNPGPSGEMMVNIMWVSITLVLWTAAYYRLKEKQV